MDGDGRWERERERANREFKSICLQFSFFMVNPKTSSLKLLLQLSEVYKACPNLVSPIKSILIINRDTNTFYRYYTKLRSIYNIQAAIYIIYSTHPSFRKQYRQAYKFLRGKNLHGSSQVKNS